MTTVDKAIRIILYTVEGVITILLFGRKRSRSVLDQKEKEEY